MTFFWFLQFRTLCGRKNLLQKFSLVFIYIYRDNDNVTILPYIHMKYYIKNGTSKVKTRHFLIIIYDFLLLSCLFNTELSISY